MTGVIDYGAGNTASVMNALYDITKDIVKSSDPEVLSKCERLILPGVGEASFAMKRLTECGITSLIKTCDVPLLGICLGMQIMGSYSEEGETHCLGLTNTLVKRFDESKMTVPNMGWCKTKINNNCKLFQNLKNDQYFYFAHSYYMPVSEITIALCSAGTEFTAALRINNFYGVQFHPEKSGSAGIQILKNFMELC